VCGILGCLGVDDAPRLLHEGLNRLEYRGYDSAGLAVGTPEDGLHVEKTAGRVDALDPASLPEASLGLAPTRWATHGPPTEANAHPHTSCDGRVAVAHNGILENHAALREELTDRGHAFTSDTDTEVVAHLLEELYEGDLGHALRRTTGRLEGSYAILAAHANEPATIVGAREASPLVAGLDDGALYLASDVVAFREHTDTVVYLEDGDLARLTSDGLIVDTPRPDPPEMEQVPWDVEDASKAGFPHFMLKEIHEQPRALREALLSRTTLGAFDLEGDLELGDLAAKDTLVFVACGSSANASRAAAPTFERRAGVRTDVTIASEFEPRSWMGEGTLVVAVTQSGETADTLAALEAAKQAGLDTLAVTNTHGSTATRTADAWTPIRAGPEISVAATKTFASQLVVLEALATHLAAARGTAAPAQRHELEVGLDELQDVPQAVGAVLDGGEGAEELGAWLADHDRCFVLGTDDLFPVAEEIALKIKEISYVHAEAFASGELKHGPLALVEEGTPVLALAPDDEHLEGLVSSMTEVAARGAQVAALTDPPETIEEHGFEPVPTRSGSRTSFPYTALVEGQRIAYACAVDRGCDVDKPRNLAKSVTVE
jgi:glucosamine--fructose-6-phosphate aminotransferase (isomerizing)